MKPQDFDTLSQLVNAHSGLVLTPDKAYLLEARLSPIARQYNLASTEELAQRLRQRPDDAMVRSVTEAMTTNESFFFRDNKPFDMVRDIMLPSLVKLRSESARCGFGLQPRPRGKKPILWP